MTIDANINYIQAYTEFNCLLEYLPQPYIDKLPKKLIELIKRQSNEQYKINIDTRKSLLEQGFSKKTKDLIAVIKYNYWSTDEEKQQLKKIFYDNENKYQKELLEKYNQESLFKKSSLHQEKNTTQEQVALVEYKESIFNKLINKIKSIFNIK